MALCERLGADELAHFLAVSLDPRSLLKLCGRLGTVPKGTRIDTLSAWELSWSLTDYYHADAEVAKAVDKALVRELGESPLAPVVQAEGGARAVEWLLFESPDPARDLAWALLSVGNEDLAPTIARLIKSIVEDYDRLEAEARAEDERAASAAAAGSDGGAATAPAPAVVVDRELEREARAAQSQRDRALRRSEGLKERVAEVEAALAEARRGLKLAEAARERAEGDAARAGAERDAIRSRLDRGLAAELIDTRAELETLRRRLRAVEAELGESRTTETELRSQVRALESARAAAGTDPSSAAEAPADAEPAGWSLPVFTDEFYDSIRRWDRKIVRIAFEKIVRLAEDWRHPSLRAIPLEGLPDAWRIRIASDVRLIYRPLDGGRVEILSLIDREDLQRYIRQAKSRPGAS